jgi:hypothetical protein
MIIPAIIEQLAKRIYDLGYIGQSGGMVQEVLRGTVFDIQAPVYPNPKPVNISPDRKESGITFFSVGPTRSLEQSRWLTKWENELTLTGWLNGDRLTEIEMAEMGVFNAMRGTIVMPEGHPVRSVTLEFAGDNEGQPIGERWGWTDPAYQYGKLPYRLFQHRYRLTYWVGAGCAPVTSAVLQPAC